MSITLVAVAGYASIFLASGCGSSESYVAEIRFVMEPERQLPPGLANVAVLDSGADVTGDKDSARERRWTTVAADMLEERLVDASQRYDLGLSVAKRRETRKILMEQDLKAAGLVDSKTATEAGRLLNVQALITSRLEIHVDVVKSTKTTYVLGQERDPRRGPPGTRGGTRTTLQPREVEQIARTLIVHCQFSMIDAVTGESIVEYAPRPFHKTDEKKPGVLFGKSASEADLDPVDLYIAELVDRAVGEFVASVVPIEVANSYKLKADSKSPTGAGIRLLRADDYDGALEQFKLGMQVEPDDEKPVFYAGIAAELSGNLDAALKYYRRALAMPKLDKDDQALFAECKDRVTTRMTRQRKS